MSTKLPMKANFTSNVHETRKKEPHYMMDLHYATWHINLKVIKIEPNGLGSR